MTRAAFALIALLLAAPLSAAAAPWLRTESPDFVLLSDLPEPELDAIATALGRLQSLLETIDSDPSSYRPELRIVAFATEEGFEHFRPERSNLDRGDGRISGFFVPGRLEDYIVLDARAETDPLNTLYHEYLHAFLRHQIPHVPLWLNEGLAEYYSTFTVRRDPDSGHEVGLLGLPKESHVRYLDRHPLMPLAKLIVVEQDSRTYREGPKTGTFYAESWALVHYLMSDDDRRAQTMRYLEQLGARQDPETAFRTAFERPPIELERELGAYLRQRTFAHSLVELPADQDLGLHTSALPEAMVQANLGDLLLSLRRIDEAAERYERALALEPDLTRAQSGIGRTLLRRGNTPLAVTWLEEAARWEDRSSGTARFLLGSALVRQARETLSGSPIGAETIEIATEQLGRARPSLRQALSIDTDLAPAQAELGRAWLLEGGFRRLSDEEADEGVRALQRAASLQPERGELVRDLAILLCRADRCRQAERAITGVLPLYNDPALIDEARIGTARAELRLAAEDASGDDPERAVEAITRLLDHADDEVYSALMPDAQEVLEIANHNVLVKAYNRALELARAGRTIAASAELEPVLRQARDPDLIRSARELERALRRSP